MSLTDSRSATAEREFDSYIFDRAIEAVGSWSVSGSDAWHRQVFFEGDAEPGEFKITFAAETDDISDVMALHRGEPVGQVSDMPSIMGMI